MRAGNNSRWLLGGLALVCLVLVSGAANPAFASLVFFGEITVTGQGFGTNNTILTFHNDGQESGCVTWTGAADDKDGPCPGGVSFIELVEGKTQTLDLQTLAGLGITSADRLGIIFNPAQEGGANEITLDTLVLTFYKFDGQNLTQQDFIWSGPRSFCCDNTGTGGAGQTFRLDFDQAQQAQANFFDVADLTQVHVGLAANIGGTGSGGNGGNETFYVYSLQPLPVPEPTSFLMMGAGLIGLVLLRRRRTKRS